MTALGVIAFIATTTSGCAELSEAVPQEVLGVAALGLGIAGAAAGAGAFTGGDLVSYDAIGSGTTLALTGAAVMAGEYDETTAANLQSFGGGVAAVGNAFAGGSGGYGGYGSYGSSGASGMPGGIGGSGGAGGGHIGGEYASWSAAGLPMGQLVVGNGYSQRGAFDDCARLYGDAAALVPQARALMAECQRRASNMGTLGAGPVTGVAPAPPAAAAVHNVPRRSHSGGAVSAK